jgi:hypothetical protein
MLGFSRCKMIIHFFYARRELTSLFDLAPIASAEKHIQAKTIEAHRTHTAGRRKTFCKQGMVKARTPGGCLD